MASSTSTPNPFDEDWDEPIVAPAAAASTPGGGPTGPSTSPRGPSTAADELERLERAYNNGWLGRLGNIGAGALTHAGDPDHKGRDIVRSLTNLTGTVLTGNMKGGYSLDARGSFEKELDRIVNEKTKVDYNASKRLSNNWTSTSDKLLFLSTKVRQCNEMEAALEDYLQSEGGEAALATTVKAAPVRAIAESRGKIAAMVKFAKAHPYVAATGTVIAGIPIAMVGYSLGITGLLVASGATFVAGQGVDTFMKGKTPADRLKHYYEMKKMIETVRADTEKERKALTKAKEVDHKADITVERKAHAMVEAQVRAAFPNPGNDAKIAQSTAALINQYEEALNSNNISRALDDFLTTLRGMKTATGTAAFSPASLAALDKEFDKLDTSSQKEFRKSLKDSIGEGTATGPEAVGSLCGRIIEVHKTHSMRGLKLGLEIGGEPLQTLTVKDFTEKGAGTMITLEGVDSTGKKFRIGVTVTKNARGQQEVVVERSTPDASKITAELTSKTDADLWLDDGRKPVGLPSADDQKALLARAKAGTITAAECVVLYNSFKQLAPKLDVLKRISEATPPKFDSVPKMVDDTRAVVSEVAIKSNDDLWLDKPGKPTGLPSADDQKALLAKAKAGTISAAECVTLFDSFARYKTDLIELKKVHDMPTPAFAKVSSSAPDISSLVAELSAKTDADLWLDEAGKPAGLLAGVDQKYLLAMAQSGSIRAVDCPRLYASFKRTTVNLPELKKVHDMTPPKLETTLQKTPIGASDFITLIHT